MTKLEDLYQNLSELGIPVTYQEFKEEQKPPYIAYFVDAEESITADGETIVSILSVEIHLITSKSRNLVLEKAVADKLKELRQGYQKDLDWDSRQKIHDTIYSIELVEGE